MSHVPMFVPEEATRGTAKEHGNGIIISEGKCAMIGRADTSTTI